MSCNGCRILRKGCSDTCILNTSLQFIHSGEAQGHATLFVAKFFGRAALMSFISAVPLNQTSAVFQSLLFEAAGRTVNPVSGAAGLLWTGNWHVCQAAVATVLRGGTLSPIPSGPDFDAADIFKAEGPPRRKASIPKRQEADLDLSLRAGFPAKKNQPFPERPRPLGSPSMNSEESEMTTCGGQPPPEIKILNLFN
ncbi:LOB domain-containing protein 37-like [Salvia miltiorrhiza]|uniref:LOB domain-containing protein 37-like n=1 Tax=Salvia miltiorrhiza TaxID=226208 RepID=UPI0025AC64D7|nr:LOB domain-containing protein 37-like [Salvia miltiorrhiza]